MLQEELSGTENEVGFARVSSTTTHRDEVHHEAQQVFPTNIMAGYARASSQPELFEITDGGARRSDGAICRGTRP